MPFDSIAIKCLCHELSGKIVESKIEKIYQPEKDEIHLLLRKQSSNCRLLISADSSNPRIHITGSAKENPLTAPMFCMLMRKHLTGGKIKSVRQSGFDRVLDIEVEAYNELGDVVSKHIIVEIMGKHSNIIFTESDMRIIDSIKHIDITLSSVRNILPGLTYTPPPSQQKHNPLSVNKNEIEQILTHAIQNQSIIVSSAILSNFLGFSPLASREIAYRSTGDIDTLLSPDDINRVSDTLFDFITQIKHNSFNPCVLYERSTGKPLDFSAFNVTLYNTLAKVKSFDLISDALDDYFVTRDKHERMRQKSASLKKTASNNLGRLRKKLKIQEDIINSAKNKDKFKIYGEFITSNMYRINYGDKAARVENFYEEGSPVIEIPLGRHKIAISKCSKLFYKIQKA